MDTLLMWNGENASAPYIFALATSEVDGPVVNGISTIGVPNPLTTDSVVGLNFENLAQLNGTTYAQYYWQYDFKIRQGVVFAPPYNYSLTPADVAYSFQRTLFQDATSGPQWMLDEPLLDNAAGLDQTNGGLGVLTNDGQVSEIGALVRDAVQYNDTDVWFNIMYPGAYPSFLQNMCQTWSSIESKQWINNQVIDGLDVNGIQVQPGRPDWNGDFSTLDAWLTTYNPAISPLDTPTPMEYGSGPYMLDSGTPDYTNGYWAATRNLNWWGGAPAFYPVEASVGPAGYADTIEVLWNYTWAEAVADFEAGACDFVALPSLANIGDIYTNGYTGSYYPYPDFATNLPDAGIRAIAPLPPQGGSVPSGWHFEYDCVNGWYYNPNYPGLNFANMYKFYYVPESNRATQSQPFSEYLPADVNHDGIVNMKDLASLARAFGSSYAQPIPAHWVFVDDLVNIRTINMKDIAFMVRQFGETSPIGTFGPLVTVNPQVNVVTAGSSITFTATCAKGYGNVNDRVIQWYYGTNSSGPQPGPTTGPTTTNSQTSTFTWNNIPAGSSYVYCTVTDTFTGTVATARTTAGLSNVVTSMSMQAGIYASNS
jgi:hypothetical protein